MSETTQQRFLPRSVVIGALALGIAGGSYGIASAASGSGSTTTPATTTSSSIATAPAAPSPGAPNGGQSWGGQRSDETLLTGDALSKVSAIATAKVSGGTIVRVETDADGHAAYEAHMTNASEAPVTVYVDKDFNFVSLETR